MDPRYSAQDVFYCTLCQTSMAPMYCDVCLINLCKDCVEVHLSDSSEVHKVVSYKQYLTTLNYPKCRKHPTKQCELHCEQCDIPICALCICGEHLSHKPVDISKIFEAQKKDLQTDLQELEGSIYSKYKYLSSNILVQKADLNKNSQTLKTAIDKQGEVFHRKIDTVIQNLKSDVDKLESQYLAVLDKMENEITQTASEITKSIAELKQLLSSKNICLVSEYKSRNVEFRGVPPKLIASFPIFRPNEVCSDRLVKLFGSLTPLSLTKEEQGYSIPPQGAESSPLEMDEPWVNNTINIWKAGRPYTVACLNDQELWTAGTSNTILLNDMEGKLIKSVQTKSGEWPYDIAVTRNGDLVYTDDHDGSVNISKNSQIHTMIRLHGWKPRGVCISSSGDILVVMFCDDNEQSKIVRYSNWIEKQNIQFNDKGNPLFSSGCGHKFISENKNLDICVSDLRARAVVVVNQAGKLRFTYTCICPNNRERFSPYGITTDSQGRILTSDFDNFCIHIIDQNGQFLRLIDTIDGWNFPAPWGLCVDSKDSLFVAVVASYVMKVKYNRHYWD